MARRGPVRRRPRARRASPGGATGGRRPEVFLGIILNKILSGCYPPGAGAVKLARGRAAGRWRGQRGLGRMRCLEARGMRVARGLSIAGDTQNNLNNISLEIPHDLLTVITGVSGSGKSSLAFDTVFAEGHWRYVESLSTYARMFLERLDRPDVDRIERIRPAVALEQKNPVRTARSTVGTATEVYDYLRLLYAKVGRLHCPRCGAPAAAHSAESIVEALLATHVGARALITFRCPVPPGASPGELWASLARRGFARVLVDGEVIDLAAPPGQVTASDIAVVVDRVVVEERLRRRLTESVELC